LAVEQGQKVQSLCGQTPSNHRATYRQTYAFRISASNGTKLLVNQSSPDFLAQRGRSRG